MPYNPHGALLALIVKHISAGCNTDSWASLRPKVEGKWVRVHIEGFDARFYCYRSGV